ncbi:HNH endonuclease signature motif containing protein [Glycomyces rhizosphaerae]|uniref:DUF222 domain-containing protein n=1 Tax=Glycomyces rhizosphaerae TaxID=2054422 RepID=A0ABV7PS74_9ACTN
MARCNTTTLEARDEQRGHAIATRMLLDDTAAVINAHNATALRIVMDAFDANVHRDVDGFSAQRDWLLSHFDFPFQTAGNIASIAKLAKKFSVLSEAALSGSARIDQVAYAMNQLNRTTAAALFARTPFRAPATSPFDADILCATPEALVAEYAAHASFKMLKRHLEELHANLAEDAELLDSLGEESLQRLELTEDCNGGMWTLSGVLSSTTGMLLDKYLKTAVPPPRQDEVDAYGVLPPQATRNAEALHQLLAGYGSSPQAATRHGHTATLDLTVDIETLQGKDTGRLPLLEGDPISVPRARLLACEGVVIPSVFNYATGEAVELGRALRLPNTALRRKLELEQPGGCAWSGCGRPVAWTEAHHIQHWADGGPTVAENLILLCRFHHGRIHTTGWSVTKTGPGQALIVHHEGGCSRGASRPCGQSADGLIDPTTLADAAGECGCSDWRSDADMETMYQGDEKDLFSTGLFPFEWSEAMTPDLEWIAEQVDEARDYFEHGINRQGYRSKATSLLFEDDEAPKIRETPVTSPPPIRGDRESSEDLIPFLGSLPGRQSRQGKQAAQHTKAQIVGDRAEPPNALRPGPMRSGPFPLPAKATEKAQRPSDPEGRETRPARLLTPRRRQL